MKSFGLGLKGEIGNVICEIYLRLLTGWGLLVAAAANVLKSLYQVVQYHRQLRPIAPGALSGTSSGLEGASAPTPLTHGVLVEKPQLNWTIATWAFPAVWCHTFSLPA